MIGAGHLTPGEARTGDHAHASRRHPSLHPLPIVARTQGEVGIRIREAEERRRVSQAIAGQSLGPEYRVFKRNRQGGVVGAQGAALRFGLPLDLLKRGQHPAGLALQRFGPALQALDRDIFREKASGANRHRTELRRMLDLLRPGDQATVYRLDRLARSQLHLLQIMEEIEGKGAKLVSLMDNIDTGTATGKMVVGVLAVLAEFERNLLMERCAAGVKIARQRNVRFGRPPKLTPSLIRQVLLAHDDVSTTVPEACRVLGISKSSYYAALREGRRQALETAEAA